MFQLEAGRALHGDCLIIHYGTKKKPLYALVDSGPNTVWSSIRIEQITVHVG